MAKSELVAASRFDDGTKVGENGKSSDYNVGEAYQGDAKQAAALKKQGLLSTEAELKNVPKAALDAKDVIIKKLEEQLIAARETIAQLEAQSSPKVVPQE